MSWVYLNSGFVRQEEALVSFHDLAIMRGYGIFDFLRVQNGKPVFLDDHLARFFYSAEQMHLAVKHTGKELKHLVLELIAANKIVNSGIRLTLTGGPAPDGFSIGDPFLIISEQPFSPPSQEVLGKGIHLITYPYQRQLPSVKTIDYLMAIWLQPYLKKMKGDDLLYYDHTLVTECPRSNFFIVDQNNNLVTASDNILKGITRNYILKKAAERYNVEERPLTLDEVYNAKEAFISSTTKLILPVVKISGRSIGDGKPGSVSLGLREWLAPTVHVNK